MSLVTIVPISLVGSISHFISYSGELPVKYYIVFIPSCISGALAGGILLRKRQSGWLVFVFGVFLLVVGLKMLKIFDFPSLIYSEMDVAFFQQCLLIIPIGMFFGLMATSLGIGCGLLIVPFYVIVIGFNMHQAITISLTTMFFLTLSTTLINNRQSLKAMETNPTKSLLIPALAGAIIGAIISTHLPADLLKNIFGVFLLIMACHIIIREILAQQRLRIWLNKPVKVSNKDVPT